MLKARHTHRHCWRLSASRTSAGPTNALCVATHRTKDGELTTDAWHHPIAILVI